MIWKCSLGGSPHHGRSFWDRAPRPPQSVYNGTLTWNIVSFREPQPVADCTHLEQRVRNGAFTWSRWSGTERPTSSSWRQVRTPGLVGSSVYWTMAQRWGRLSLTSSTCSSSYTQYLQLGDSPWKKYTTHPSTVLQRHPAMNLIKKKTKLAMLETRHIQSRG